MRCTLRKSSDSSFHSCCCKSRAERLHVFGNCERPQQTRALTWNLWERLLGVSWGRARCPWFDFLHWALSPEPKRSLVVGLGLWADRELKAVRFCLHSRLASDCAGVRKLTGYQIAQGRRMLNKSTTRALCVLTTVPLCMHCTAVRRVVPAEMEL